jgi:hypothetical protein
MEAYSMIIRKITAFERDGVKEFYFALFNACHERKHRSKPSPTSALLRTEAKGDALPYRMNAPLLARIVTQQYRDSASPLDTEPVSPLRRSPGSPRMSRVQTLKSP